MNKQKEKVPDLRFKGFTDDWEQHKLGDALEEFSYGLNTPATKFDGKNKYLRITDIDDDTHAFNQTSLTSPKDKDDNYILGQGDILFARTGASVGKTYMYKANDGKVYYAGFLIKGHIKNGFSTEFIFNTTRLPQYQNFVKVTSMRSGQPGINAKEYQNYVIYVPVKQEQERIGQLISKLDTLITLHQRKLVLLKQLKKGLLQKMFADKDSKRPILRFEGFSNDWKQYKLSDLVKIDTGKLDANAMVSNGKYDFYTSGIKKYKINNYAFKGPAITIAGNGATVGYMHYADNKFNAYQRTYVLTDLKADRRFLFNSIQLILPHKIYQESRTGNIPYIVLSMLTDLLIMVPSNKEQTFIGNLAGTISDIYNKQLKKLNLTNQLKKSLLQQMFI